MPAFGEGEQVREADPAVPSWLVVGDLAVFEELDQGRAADAEEVGGLLGVGCQKSAYLVTCDDGNLASARTIERNGGVLEDVRTAGTSTKRRYWITI